MAKETKDEVYIEPLGRWETRVLSNMLHGCDVAGKAAKHGIEIEIRDGKWSLYRRLIAHEVTSFDSTMTERLVSQTGLDMRNLETETGVLAIAATILMGAYEDSLRTASRTVADMVALNAENVSLARTRGEAILAMWDAMGKKRRKRLDSATYCYAKEMARQRDAEAEEYDWRTGAVDAHGAITAILCWQVLVCVIRVTLQHLGIGGITIEREEVSE